MADEILDVMEIFRGDDETFEMNFVDEDGNAVDITNFDINFSMKKPGNDTVLIEKSSDYSTQIEKTTPLSGIALLKLLSSDTSDLDPGSYEYDVQYIENTNIHTYKKGIFVIKGDVTP